MYRINKCKVATFSVICFCKGHSVGITDQILRWHRKMHVNQDIIVDVSFVKQVLGTQVTGGVVADCFTEWV